MHLFALVLSDGPLALELFATSREAETAFAPLVRHEPGFAELLEIHELATNTALPCNYPCSPN